MIKAINTRYKGYNFRSRTEARWAVFFDALGWSWEYEREGFQLPSGNYLPDFYFPDLHVYAEVKGKAFTEHEKQLCKELSAICSSVILLDGPPGFKAYDTYVEREQVSPVVFITKGAKYHPFFYTYDFDPEYFDQTVEAVNEALSARFEFNGK